MLEERCWEMRGPSRPLLGGCARGSFSSVYSWPCIASHPPRRPRRCSSARARGGASPAGAAPRSRFRRHRALRQ
eukprot:4827603-Pleurochrysis_carterae.AAC.2